MATHYYMRLDGIQGDATANGYRGWFEIAAVSKVTTPSLRDPASGQVSGKRQHQPIQIVKLGVFVGAGLAGLGHAAMNGKSIHHGEIVAVEDGQVRMRFLLSEIALQFYQTSGQTGSERMIAELTLSCSMTIEQHSAVGATAAIGARSGR